MEKEPEDLRAALHPVALLNATRQILGSAVRWTTAEKGETVNRLFAWLGLLFVCGVLAYNYPEWSLVAIPVWLLVCGGVALQDPSLQKHRAASDHELESEEEDEPEEDRRFEGDDFAEDAGYEDDSPDPDEQDHEAGESYRDKEADRARQEKTQVWWTLVEREVATAVHQGTKGVRVATLLSIIQERGHLPDWDEARLVAMLRSIEIPVREQMYFKINGKKSNKHGVHVEDLTEALGRAPHLPAHLVPDLTPSQPPAGARVGPLSLVKEGEPEEVA
ncbi:hypothetical protein ACPXCO_23440 [Streptomyces cyaneofuscatus]|uniref:hypothetical protein n=1 Tax=Streptomyces cyaneofuscatus TaxID=66883 RepID=UPI003CF0EEA5